MTANEWNAGTEWLESGNEGDFVQCNGRTAEIACMVGGRYALYDEHGRFDGLVDETWKAMDYLKHGRRTTWHITR